MIDLTRKAEQKLFGDMVGISQPAVSNLVSRGVLSDGAALGDWLREYCSNLREQAAGRAAAGDLDLAAERARLAAEQADKIALQNKVTRQEFAPVSLIQETMASVGRQIAGILEALPVKLKRNTDISAEQLELIEADIAEARNLAAAVRPTWDEIDVPDAY